MPVLPMERDRHEEKTAIPEGPYTPSDPAMQEAGAFHRFRESVPALTDDELIRRVNGDFSAAFWRRYNILAAKLHAETMTLPEQQEFLAYTDRTEAWGAERLVSLLELAGRRGVTAESLIKQYRLRAAGRRRLRGHRTRVRREKRSLSQWTAQSVDMP